MKKVKNKIDRKIIKKSKKEFVIKYLASIILRAIVLINPILFSKAIDNVTNGSFNRAYFYIIISIVLIIIYRLFEVLNTYTWHKLYNKLYESYTDIALQSTHNNSLFSLSRISNSEYINILNNDINTMSDFLCNFVIRSIRIFEFIIIFFYFYNINLFVGISSTSVSLIAFLTLYLSSIKIEQVNKQKLFELDRKTNVITEFFLGIKEIKNFNIFEQIRKRGTKYTKNYTKAFLTQRVVEDGYKHGGTLLLDLFRLGLVIYGFILISKGQMTIGVLLVIYNYYAQLIENFTEFASFNINFRQFKVAKNRYYKLMEYTRSNSESTELYNQDLIGTIEFKNVLYGYRDNPTLNDVSFKFEPNTINAIVGKPGSGKTGIFDLLLKLNRQHEGIITVDNVDINLFNNNHYLNNISLVNKEPTFFNMSIRENLSMINENFSDAVRICKQLEIHEEIMQLKDGYDTIISTIGAPLTNTLKYFLGIARGLIRNSKIMLFDESFDTFDKETRTKIINLLQIYKKNHTLIIITKEVDFLEIADQIILIDQKKLIKSGSHNTLQKSDLYKKIIIK